MSKSAILLVLALALTGTTCPLRAGEPDMADTGDNGDVIPAPAPTAQPLERTFRSMQQLDELIGLGMPGLAMRLIEQQQKLYPAFTTDWYAFEFKRIQTQNRIEDWDGVISRTQWTLETARPGTGEINIDIGNWLRTQQVIALLQSGEGEKALALSRYMLWNTPQPSTTLVQLWRRMVIRAYFQLDLMDDAKKALQKYRQDYGTLSADFRVLQARALLRARRNRDVIALLADDSSHTARALRLVAAVRSKPRDIRLYEKDIRHLLEATDLSDSHRRAYWRVLYEAASVRQDNQGAAKALERILALSRRGILPGDEFEVGGDELWRLYEEIGLQSGNSHGLLLGDDAAWLSQAEQLETDAPEQAIGLYAVLALGTLDPEIARVAHERITQIVAEKDNGLEIINQLYLHSAIVNDRRAIPESVRFRLVDYALSVGDVGLAAEMMATLPRPPPEQDAFDWQIRKARVLILEGRHEEGERELQSSLQGRSTLDSEMIDRYLQVVFDLQTIERHDQALLMFDLLPEAQLDEKVRRELYFWKAESSYALEHYDRAAWLYLRSARTGDPEMTDLWAQSARFKAADALLQAELYDDAAHAYKTLLEITLNESRRRLIRQKLQHIRLLRNAESQAANPAEVVIDDRTPPTPSTEGGKHDATL